MKYEELFVEILTVVSDVTSLSVVDILTSNREECVNARHILIYTLSVRGFSDCKIAELMKITRPAVCMARNSFKYRRKRYFVNLHYQEVYSLIFVSKEPVNDTVKKQ